ncbi:MAG: DUF4266 domain-containing protein [Verrucomicrobiota bacterium]
MKRKLPFYLLLAGLSLGAGCTTVKPWQRSTLADYTMRGDRDPLTVANDEHIYFSREAASGGRGVGGGGCGCN